ncbi:MAG: hypothetical protein Q8L14_31105 [Myxococcales bacterium]|nr:hypothetical protein [Myxococcales bacterium]
MPFAYPFVGNRGLLEEARARGPTGVPWLSANQVLLPVVPGLLDEGATFVVSLSNVVLVAPRRSEHVACAGGLEVLAAGELFFATWEVDCVSCARRTSRPATALTSLRGVRSLRPW